MPLAWLFEEDGPVQAALRNITVVALVGRNELDPAVTVQVVVLVHKRPPPSRRAPPYRICRLRLLAVVSHHVDQQSSSLSRC